MGNVCDTWMNRLVVSNVQFVLEKVVCTQSVIKQ